MVIELVAGRAIAPYLGQSLYTWTAVIGIVLAGMSVGNYLGGRLADRFDPHKALPLLFILASLGTLSVLLINPPVGQWHVLRGLAWPARIFCHVMLVFFAPSAFLGMISPVVAKMALDLGYATGRTIGSVYASGVAGSILGTFLTGYWLLAIIGVRAILGLAAGGLAIVGILHGFRAIAHTARVARPVASVQPKAGVQAAETMTTLRLLLPSIAAVFIAGFSVMALETVAGRVAARFFGQSLYSWTTVIGVVLTGLTLGGYIGGRLADRFPIGKALAVVFILASGACLDAPALATCLGTSPLLAKLPAPAILPMLLMVTVAYFAPSVLLGAVTPLAAKLALNQGCPPGRTVGIVYAANVVGSILGTFLAGFYLIAAIGAMGLTCAVTVLIGFVGFSFAPRNRWARLWAAVCIVALLALAAPGEIGRGLGRALFLRYRSIPGTIYEDESQYAYITVRMPNPERPALRQMFIDKMIHSEIDLNAPLHHRYVYEQIYEAVLARCFPPPYLLHTLVIGGGGYTFPQFLEAAYPDGYVEVAEIDPDVTEAAYNAFGLPRDTAINIVHLDARNRVDDLVRRKRAGEDVPSFECILGDAFNHYTVP